MNRESIVTPNQYKLSKVGGETMVSSDIMSNILIVNEFGAEILEVILKQKCITIDSIVNKFNEIYQAESLESDIIDFIGEMEKNEVILIS